MRRLSSFSSGILAALALTAVAAPAIADVKSGVDAWSRGEYEAAVKQWREAAIKGDADAQFNMGQAYKLGRGVKQDLNVASDWYRKAAGKGHLQAADSLGHLLHYQGKVGEALPYLQVSADRGDPRSQYLLATELFNGTNITKDWVRAYAFMTRSSAAGLAPASRSLAQMDQYIPLDQRQQAMVLAAELEKKSGQIRAQQVSGFPINTSPPPKVVKPIAVPPSVPQSPPVITGPTYPAVDGGTTVPPVVTAPKPKTPAPAPVASGSGWRIQLGAFGNEANAKNLWNSLEGKVSELGALTPYLRAAGKVTRLQAGPFSSRNSAEAMCVKVRASNQACIVVPG